MMKKTILGALVVLCSFTANSAQTKNDSIIKPVKNISVEFLGASNGIGVQYDSRFKGNSDWGYTLGAGWGFSQANNFFGTFNRYDCISISPRINYLVGRKNRKLELGFGVNVGYLFGKSEYNTYKKVVTDDGYITFEVDERIKENHKELTYFFFGNIGYRRQAPRGFVFRAGVAPVFGFGGNTVDKFYIVPYIGLGKSF